MADFYVRRDIGCEKGTSNNTYIVTRDGTLITRNLSTDILHGITRASVLKLAAEAQMKVVERPFTIAEAQDAAEAFITAASTFVCGTLSAFEVMWNNFYTLVTTEPAKNSPPISQDYPYYVLVEAMGSDDDRVEAVLAQAYEDSLIVDAVVSRSEAQRLQLWAMRDDVEQCFRYAPLFTFDVSMRISHMEAYLTEVDHRLGEAYTDYTNFTFGHMGDGNLHLVISVGEGGDEHRERVEGCVYEPLREICGSVSAEHGVGLEKKPNLGISRSADEIALMRTVKKALDPRGILNPGKIFDLGETAA